MTTFTSEDRQEAYQKKVEDAPYHPGYEDAVVPPKPAYKGMDPAKMIWKSKPLSDDEIDDCVGDVALKHDFYPEEIPSDKFIKCLVKTIEERHGIK